VSDPDTSRALERARAEGWERGFDDGQLYGSARERHDPQWDWDGPPERPKNPYRPPHRNPDN
jgi:hypothetical protein